MSARVFLDACVLYPPLVRAMLLGAAADGLYRPLWTARVLDEWAIAAARHGAAGGAEPAAAIAAEREAMARRFPDAEISPGNPDALAPLPDPGDAHVLAGAVAGGADALVTFNLRDFPARALAEHGLTPRHPDGFLWELLGEGGAQSLGPTLARVLPEPDRAANRRALKRARLPRLGKAWEAMGGA